MYAIIDVETTGGNSIIEKITEIAIYQHDGEKITGEFVSLVNPEREIPYYITNLTGITNEMVDSAPCFFEIAKEIILLTEGRTIVAHNAKFDYSFLRQEFKSLGFNFSRNLLDTVTLSRKLFPGLKSYSLANLCSDIGISIEDRHRAGGDALATTRLLEILLQKDKELNNVTSSLFKKSISAKLNPKLDVSKLDIIPDDAGIYYFYNESGDLIYIGKSKNIYKRVHTHLSNNTTQKSISMRDQIADIDWEVTGSELIALIKESHEIKDSKPQFNLLQKQKSFQWGIFRFSDEDGYINYRYGINDDYETPLSLFKSKEKAKSKLLQLIDKYELCMKLTGMYDTDYACFHFHIGKCKGACCKIEPCTDYNKRAEKVTEEFIFKRKNFFIVDKGRDDNEKSAVKVVDGKYKGFGYFLTEEMGFGFDSLHNCIKDMSFNNDIHIILKQYIKANKAEKIIYF